MEGSRFDDLARASAISRRSALKALGGAIAGMFGVRAGSSAIQPFQRAGKRCDKGQPCGDLAPCSGGFCTPIACEIGGVIYQANEPNPDNSCLFCSPSLNDWTSWNAWFPDGTACTKPSSSGCFATDGICSNGFCVPDQLPDGTSCGDGQVCCGGNCCGAGECCGDSGCEACFAGCEIAGQRFDAGALNPSQDCQVCDPAVSTTAWSPLPDATTCGGVAGRACCNGACCSPTECCSDAGQCVDCFDGCEIQGQPVDPGTINPEVDCLFCDPIANEFDWSPRPDNSTCGGVPGRVCCNGACCSPTECCNPNGFCEDCGPHCRIGGVDVAAGMTNPDDECLVCDPDQSLNDWSPAPDDATCGNGGSQVCCGGDCCGPDQCCDPQTGCGSCWCQIGAGQFGNGQFNPDNPCQMCDYQRDPDDWSSSPNDVMCGNNHDRSCCNGECCQTGNCCILGECAPCPCEIDGVRIEPGDFNQINPCQYCDPAVSRSSWTSLADGDTCNGTDGQQCCGGFCCPAGQCCNEASCQDCGCQINGATYASGTVNVDNACLVCDPARNRSDWSSRPDSTTCGPNGDQSCCAGNCCDSGDCCILDACGTCLCSILNVNYPEGAINEDVDCQICDPRRDPFDWSTAPDDGACGENADQVCCSGVCCPVGQCCEAGECVVCGCTIGNELIPDGTVNPDNGCQVCDHEQDPNGWSPTSNDVTCGPDGTRHCCDGECCDSGECCILGICSYCGCTINGIPWEVGELNPDNRCQSCDPVLNHFDWSPQSDTPCGEQGQQTCCDGLCCDPGYCCGLQGACELCKCVIDGVEYLDGQVNPHNYCEGCDIDFPDRWTARIDIECPPPCVIDGQSYAVGHVNPNNECEICNPYESTTTWTPADNRLCGETSDQVCCNSVCCALDECCGDTGSCQSQNCPPTTCDIAGQQVPDGANNPLNPCEYCDVSRNPYDWSGKTGQNMCGASNNQWCCNGACCPLGICCNLGTVVCDPDYCHNCVIDGQVYKNGDRNPANGCEWCNDFVADDRWTLVSPNYYCDPVGKHGACCGGMCCADGNYCRTIDYTCQPI